MSLNRNKRSVCVDLKTTEGRNVVKDLVGVSDVFIENYIPGKMEELGLGYQDLAEFATRMIYCSISGFGSDGPYKDR